MLPLVENETDENSLRLFAPVSPFFAECAIASLCEKRTRFLRVSNAFVWSAVFCNHSNASSHPIVDFR